MVLSGLLFQKEKTFFQFFGSISKGGILIIILSVLLFENSRAQKISKVEITEIKKGENMGSFSLKLYDFPREASSVKPYVNRIGSIPGVITFQVISHPVENPAQAILTVQDTDLKQNTIKEVLCVFNASLYEFRKTTFSECSEFILNKK